MPPYSHLPEKYELFNRNFMHLLSSRNITIYIPRYNHRYMENYI